MRLFQIDEVMQLLTKGGAMELHLIRLHSVLYSTFIK